MSKFSTKYEDVENVIATMRQATMRRDIIALYLNNQELIKGSEEAQKVVMAILAEFDRISASQIH